MMLRRIALALGVALFSGVMPSLGANPAPQAGVIPLSLSDDLLLVFSRPKSGRETDFVQWYDQHLRQFVKIPGIRAAQRFTLVKQGKISEGLLDDLAMYDVSSEKVANLDAEVRSSLKSGAIIPGDDVYEPSMFHLLYRPLGPAVQAHSIHGSNPEPIGAGPLSEAYLVVLSDPTTPDQEDAYNNWYDHQHMPDVLRVPGFESAQRFVRVGGSWKEPRYLVMFKFKSRDINATNGEVGRRIREKITVMSPTFGAEGAQGVIAVPAGQPVLAGKSAGKPIWA